MEEYRATEYKIEAGLNFPKQESESEDTNSDVKGSERRSCAECHTIKTPLWRSGPAGPRSLCNACGIRYRKKRKLALNLGKNKEELAGKENKSIRRRNENRVIEVCSSNLESFMVIDRHVLERSKLREEERAAIMLMALSCGSIFA